MDEPWAAQLKETNFRLEGKADRFQLESFHSELSALELRVKSLEAELVRVRAQGGAEQPNGKAEEVVNELQKPEIGEAAESDVDVREYTLEESAWDSLLVCGLATYAGESVMIVCGCLLNISIQFIYCYTVWTSVATPVLTTDKLKDLAIWRVAVGHDVRNLDQPTGTSLVDRTCANQGFAITSTAQQTLYYQLDTYPPLLCVISLFFWIMIVLSDMANTFDFVRGICSLPRARHSRIECSPDGSMAVEAISRKRLLLLIVTVVVPKFVIAVCMGFLGVTYLIFTKSAADLLLNAIALQFVMDTDELLFTEIVPLRVRSVITSVKPLAISGGFRIPQRWRRRVPLRAIALVILCFALVTIFSVTLLARELDMLARGRELMCGGNKHFTFTTDRSTGTVITADLEASEQDEIFTSYLFRTVFEKTGLEPAKTLEELGSFTDEVLYISKDAGEVEEWDRFTFREATDQLPCLNLASESAAYREALFERSNGISNCSQLKDSICEVGLRPFCPIACGCSDPGRGLYSRLGCSSQCDLLEETAFQRQLGLWLQLLGTCQDGLTEMSSEDTLGGVEAYFDEVQKQLLYERVLLEYPDYAPGFVWVSADTVLNVVAKSFFQAYLPVTNITLGKWARQGMEHTYDGTLQDPLPCGMVAFVYKVFQVDLCDTSESTFFQGRVGSIRYLCMKTCGYCGDSAPPYKEMTWESLAAWTDEVLEDWVLEAQNVTDLNSLCAFYEQFSSLSPEVASLC